MTEIVGIPCVLMRGGTSKGPFFLAAHLPAEPKARDEVLLAMLGSGHELQVDGVGGGHPLTSKVAIVSPSKRPGVDVDYLFAQVHVTERRVDTGPNCGNMLAAVGPFAVEAGIVSPQDGLTNVHIFNLNTNKSVPADVQTPGGRVQYTGDTAISGVPGTAAPILLTFVGAEGSKTGALLPTGRVIDVIDGVEVSCVDAAMPVVIIAAEALGLVGDETPARLNADSALLTRLESIRLQAGRLMGLGDVSASVIPKPVLVSRSAIQPGLRLRYFMPHLCHPSMSITGSVAMAMASVTPGTLAHRLVGEVLPLPVKLTLEHPLGSLEVAVRADEHGGSPVASVVRTARRLFDGVAYAPVE